MSYLVLARKWRPTQFEDVVGQHHVARTLMNAIEQDRVAHAFLFTGARGVGKTSTARILAKALNCERTDGPTPSPCGECDSCVAITAGQSVDVFEIDGASNRGINEIRELRESVRYAPSRARYKIYIIDEVHMLTTEAFNALLKTLEEPPPHAKFVFATTEPQKIPVTILSRCQRYDFKRIGLLDIVEYLETLCKKEGLQAERAALQVIARQAAGGMRDALSLLDQVISFAGTTITESQVNEILGVANRRHLFALSGAILGHDPAGALTVLDEVNQYGYDLQQFCSEFVRHIRDLMVVSVVSDATRATDLTDSEMVQAQQQVDGVDATLLHRCFSVLSSTAQEMARSSFPKLVFEMSLLRMAHLEPLIGLDTIVDRLVLLESSFDEDLPPVEMPASIAPRSARIEAKVVAESPAVVKAEPSPPTPLPEAKVAELPVVEESGSESVAEAASAPEPPAKPEPTVMKPEPAPEPVSSPESSGSNVVEVVARDDSPPPGHPAYIEPDPDRPAAQIPVSNALEPLAEVVETPAEEPAESAAQVATGDSLQAIEAARQEAAAAAAGPAEEDAVELEPIARLAPDQVAAMNATQRWQAVVDAVRTRSQPLAATCEHAYVEAFDDGKAEVSFSDRYLGFIREEGRLEQVKEVVLALFGTRYQLSLKTRDDEVADDRLTIAEAREVELDGRRKSLEEEVLNNPVLKEAQELFEVEPDAVRVQVKLFDDP